MKKKNLPEVKNSVSKFVKLNLVNNDFNEVLMTEVNLFATKAGIKEEEVGLTMNGKLQGDFKRMSAGNFARVDIIEGADHMNVEVLGMKQFRLKRLANGFYKMPAGKKKVGTARAMIINM